MAGAALDIRYDLDHTKASTLIAGILARGKDPRRVFKVIVVDLERSAADTFRAEGRPTPWKRLSPVTIARRRKGKRGQGAVGGSVKILQDTGRLRMSVSGRARGSVRRFGRVDLTFGTNLAYAADQQYGRARKPGQKETVKAHRRKAHSRGSIKVKAHRVTSFIRTVTWPKVPARPYLLWQHQDVDGAIKHLLHYMVWGRAY